MSLRFHEISEANHRILNPITLEKLMLLGEICGLYDDTTQLDLCCGKGEMLLQWSRRWGISGLGVDISKVFLAAVEQRKVELDVPDAKVKFVEADATNFIARAGQFDIVSCIGATWIGEGLTGTVELLKPHLNPGGLMLIGEPFWRHPVEGDDQGFTNLVGTLDRIESCGMTLIEMVLADDDSWDRYVCAQWKTVDEWVRAHPESPDAEPIQSWIGDSRRTYLSSERGNLGWGVFVLKSLT